MMRRFSLYLFLACGIFQLLLGTVESYVASSTNYRIQSDSINFAGGLSTSSSYTMQDTLGEIASGESASTTVNYKLKAGYQQMHEVYLALSAPSNVTMSPVIDQELGGISSGVATWNIITDSPAGYTFSIKASTDPALASADGSFDNYTPGGVADYEWSVVDTKAEFGMSPEGDDIAPAFQDNGSTCGVGSLDTALKCWAPIKTTDTVIAVSGDGTHPTGVETSIRLQAELGSNKPVASQPSGTYQAQVTVTAIAL